MRESISLEDAALRLLAYCRERDWSGYDPYDALNSRILSELPVLNRRLPRIVLTQALKRSPVNIRRMALIPTTQNPKAIALFLSACLKLSRLLNGADLAAQMIDRLVSLRSTSSGYWCWGYSFPWQTRSVVVPAWTPNLVCTTFVAEALLDAYERLGDRRCLAMAISAARYIADELYWQEGTSAGFSYPLPALRGQIHNANFLAAALLCRVDALSGDLEFAERALAAARCSASYQRADGSWPYSEAPTHRWIDNFHTGYNLCGLQAIAVHAGTSEFDSCIRKGFDFYRSHFFTADGAAKYFHNRTYPIDVHCIAQSIITLIQLRHLDPRNVALAGQVWRWAMDHMWDRRGFFYYRVLRMLTIRTSYMRWSQAWMLVAMATMVEQSGNVAETRESAGLLAHAC